jgi:hypothetical protein
VSSRLYIEGGESKEDQIRCREGFRKLIEKAGFTGRLPRLSACGGCGAAFDDFKTAHAGQKTGEYIARRSLHKRDLDREAHSFSGNWMRLVL